MIACAFHSGCADGFGAASSLRYIFNDRDLVFFPVSHNDPNEKFWEFVNAYSFDAFYIMDFSFTVDQMLLIASKSRVVTWVDHHKTAEYLVEKLSNVKNLNIHFSLEQSGAYIAWKSISGTVPTLINDIGNVDMWRTECEESFAVVNGLFHKMNNFRIPEGSNAIAVVSELMEYFQPLKRSELLAIGTVLTEETKSYCQGKIKHAFNIQIAERTLIAQFSTVHNSELGNALCRKYGMPACVINPSFDPKIGARFSLSFRSLDELDSVDSLAIRLGGGGHRNASATRIEWNRLVPTSDGYAVLDK